MITPEIALKITQAAIDFCANQKIRDAIATQQPMIPVTDELIKLMIIIEESRHA